MANNWEALNISPTDDRSAKDVLSEFYGKEYTNKYFADVFSKINAADFANAYQAGIIPTEEEARLAVKNGEYVKSSNDYIVEKLYDIFNLGEYEEPTGFVSKGATHDNIHIPQISQQSLDHTIASAGGSRGVHFSVGDASYFYNTKTGQIIRENDGKVVSGADEINQYARDNYQQFPDGANTGSSANDHYTSEDYSTGIGYVDGSSYAGIPIMPGNGSATGGTDGSFGGGYTGGYPDVPSTGGYVVTTPSVGGSTGITVGKSGADALADYLSALKIDSDFSKNLNTSRENIESKYNTLFEDLRTGDYTKEPYYQTILDSYGIKGDAAANDASASGAAANGGNLDSYAAANAKRQELAYKNAAESAALNAYNSEVASLLKTLGDLGVNVNDLYKTWASELDSQRSGAVNAYLGQLGAETDRYVSDNTLAGDKYIADTNKYLGDLDLAGTKYQTEAQKYLGDLQAQIDKYKADAEIQINADKNAANKELAQLEITYNTTMADLDRKHESLLQEKQTASAERIAQIEKEIREIEATKAEATSKYEADMKYATELLKASSEANKKAEDEAKVEEDANAKLKPTDSMKNSALKAYNEGGIEKLAEYLATVPAYDIDLLYEYAIANGTYNAGSAGNPPAPLIDLNGRVHVTQGAAQQGTYPSLYN